jgi:hypothetical protein
MEHDAVQLTRRKISSVAGITAAGLAAVAFAALGTPGAAAMAATMPAAPVAQATPATSASGTGPELIISTGTGKLYSVDPSNPDLCQNVPGGTSSYSADSPITMTPDGTVWTAAWPAYSNLVNIGTYNPASVDWATDTNPLGVAPPHYVAGLLAMSPTLGLGTGYYSSTLMTVNFKTGTWKDVGSLPMTPADGLTWATNGDLIMAGTNNHLYRLPAAVLASAINGNGVKSGDWLDLGTAVVPSSVVWFNPLTWSGRGSDVYGLATGPDGTLYVATRDVGIYTLAPNNVPTTSGPSRALQLNPLRSFPGGTCSFSGDNIQGMTITGDTLFAPTTTDSAVAVSGTAGAPISGTITSSMVQAPVTVSAAANALPAGVTLASNGTLSGTPVTAGTTTVTVKICGQDTCVTRPVTLAIAAAAAPAGQKPPPADPTMTLSGSASAPISGTLPGSAAAAPSTFTVTSPSQLPPGVSIDPSGNLMGIPSTAGTYPIPVKACNATGCTTGTVTITVGPDQSPCAQKPASTVAFHNMLAHLDYVRF